MSTVAREWPLTDMFLLKIADPLAVVRLWLLGFGQPIIVNILKTYLAEHHPL